MKELVKKFTEGFGPSGFEDSIREIIRKEVEPFVDEVRVDALGNLICFKKGNGGQKGLLDAHMDEIGVTLPTLTKTGSSDLAV